jgi:hypothetical protein
VAVVEELLRDYAREDGGRPQQRRGVECGVAGGVGGGGSSNVGGSGGDAATTMVQCNSVV